MGVGPRREFAPSELFSRVEVSYLVETESILLNLQGLFRHFHTGHGISSDVIEIINLNFDVKWCQFNVFYG